MWVNSLQENLEFSESRKRLAVEILSSERAHIVG